MNEDSDPDYSPEMLQKSWAILKVYRRLADIHHHYLTMERALERARDAWFESVEEKDENKFLIMSKSYSDLAQRRIHLFFQLFEGRARYIHLLSSPWIEAYIRKNQGITKPCRIHHCHCPLSDKLLIFLNIPSWLSTFIKLYFLEN